MEWAQLWSYKTQYIERIWIEIQSTFNCNGTFRGWKSMHQGFRTYLSWNPWLKAIEKHILNTWCMLFHLVKVPWKVFSILFKFLLLYCNKESYYLLGWIRKFLNETSSLHNHCIERKGNSCALTIHSQMKISSFYTLSKLCVMSQKVSFHRLFFVILEVKLLLDKMVLIGIFEGVVFSCDCLEP